MCGDPLNEISDETLRAEQNKDKMLKQIILHKPKNELCYNKYFHTPRKSTTK